MIKAKSLSQLISRTFRITYLCSSDHNKKDRNRKNLNRQTTKTNLKQIYLSYLKKIEKERQLSKRNISRQYQKQPKDGKKQSKNQQSMLNFKQQIKNSKNKNKNKNIFYIIASLLLLINWQQESYKINNNTSQDQLFSLLTTDQVEKQIIITRKMEFNQKSKNQYQKSQELDDYITVCYIKDKANSKIFSYKISNLAALLEHIQKTSLDYKVNFVYSTYQKKKPSQVILNIIGAGIIGLFIYFIIRVNKMQQGSNLNSLLNLKKFEPIKPDDIKTTFKDIAGMHEAKSEITQFVDFLKNPDRYLEMGAKVPKGALLTGPPGTGKTLLARACAGEAGVPFFYVSGSQFVEKYVGMGANRVRSLFDSAKKAAPSIIFIDEIDAIGKKRNSGPFSNEQKQATLNQLLVNMDGFQTNSKVIVMAATNLKDALDPALLRPGRFDRAVQISLPNFQERIEILQVHLKKIKFSKQFTLEQLAKKISIITPQFSGAQLANICNEAAILAARNNLDEIGVAEFQKATERVLAGLQKRSLFSEEEKTCLAFYEAGKAVASWFTEGADPVIKISIVPYSKQSKGYSHSVKSESALQTEQQLLKKVVCKLAGRTSQKIFKGYITNNGDKDLQQAKMIVTYIVKKFGMSQLGNIGYPDIEYVRKPYSSSIQEKIDQEILRIYNQCELEAEKLIKEKKEVVKLLMAKVMEKQTLNHTQIKQILGERPFKDNQNYLKFLKDAQEGQKKSSSKKQQELNVTPVQQN